MLGNNPLNAYIIEADEKGYVGEVEDLAMEGVFKAVKKFFSGPKFSKNVNNIKDKKSWLEKRNAYKALLDAMLKEVNGSDTEDWLYKFSGNSNVGSIPTLKGEISPKHVEGFVKGYENMVKQYNGCRVFLFRTATEMLTKRKSLITHADIRALRDRLNKGYKGLMKGTIKTLPKGFEKTKLTGGFLFIPESIEMPKPVVVLLPDNSPGPDKEPFFFNAVNEDHVVEAKGSWNKKEVIELLELLKAILQDLDPDSNRLTSEINALEKATGGPTVYDFIGEDDFDSSGAAKVFEDWETYGAFTKYFYVAGGYLSEWYDATLYVLISALSLRLAETIDKYA